jgi:hypothetical protein
MAVAYWAKALPVETENATQANRDKLMQPELEIPAARRRSSGPSDRPRLRPDEASVKCKKPLTCGLRGPGAGRGLFSTIHVQSHTNTRGQMTKEAAFNQEPLRASTPKRLKRVVLLIVATLVALGGWYAYRVLYTLRGIPDAYAMWDTGLLLIDYMQSHENRWPSGWDDLKESWDRRQPVNSDGEYTKGGMTLDQLRTRVVVDWNLDAARIASTPEGDNHLHAVWTVDGNTTLWSPGDPNQMIWDYLHGRYPPTPATTQATTRE